VRLGRSSFTLTVTATCGTEVRFVAKSTLVYIDPDGRAAPWPPAIRTPLENFTGETS
jgi:4-hydroxybenzoyl-CoA thioesterase